MVCVPAMFSVPPYTDRNASPGLFWLIELRLTIPPAVTLNSELLLPELESVPPIVTLRPFVTNVPAMMFIEGLPVEVTLMLASSVTRTARLTLLI